MSLDSGYRIYARKCLDEAKTATPVRRAHLRRVALTWLEIATQMENKTLRNATLVTENDSGVDMRTSPWAAPTVTSAVDD
jgi:hypothetical protein